MGLKAKKQQKRTRYSKAKKSPYCQRIVFLSTYLRTIFSIDILQSPSAFILHYISNINLG